MKVSKEQAAHNRAKLIETAARLIRERGIDGVGVAEIGKAAGLTHGALYAHFGSKAELLVAALRAHGRRVLADLLAADPSRPVTDLLLQVGRSLPRRQDSRGYLVTEALIAARRDEEVAGPMREYIGERAGWLAGLVQAGQAEGVLDAALSPGALAHFCLLLSLGSSLLPEDLHAVDDAEWAALLTRVVSALAPPAAQAGEAP